MICRVKTDHQRSYETPIIAQAGERVKVVRPDADAPGWVWCEHLGSKRAGWTPEAYLLETGEPSIAALRRPYDAIELAAAAGDRVEGSEAIAGWTWCVDASGHGGWMPDEKLEPESET